MKKTILVCLFVLAFRSTVKADTTGCYVLLSNPNHCYEATSDFTDIPKDILTFDTAQLWAKYGLLLGSVLSRSIIAVQEYDRVLKRQASQIRRLKKVCGSKCKGVK